MKPHVLRYWEQEFPQLKPVKRRGNRRYYQRQDVIIIRQIRSLLYEQGFTIGGARNKLGGEEARVDVSQSQQIVKQMRMELEELLRMPAALILVRRNRRQFASRLCSSASSLLPVRARDRTYRSPARAWPCLVRRSFE